jgi:hypothetical protein
MQTMQVKHFSGGAEESIFLNDQNHKKCWTDFF